MNTETLTLTDFVLARIADDEEMVQFMLEKADGDRRPVEDGITAIGCSEQGWHVGLGPARVLAECDARRCIAHLHGPKHPGSSDCKSCADGWEDMTYGENGYDPQPYPCLTAKNLALPYAEHPDYRNEWRP
jgi:hypothetical protein